MKAPPARWGWLFGVAVVACATTSPSPPAGPTAPVEPSVASEPAPEASPAEPFATFSQRFRDALAAGEGARFVGSEGVLFSHNPGAFIVLQHAEDWDALTAATRATGQLLTYAPRCDPDAVAEVPRFSCETERWSVAATCVEGETQTTRPVELVDVAEKYELLDGAAAAELRTHAEALQARVSHFFYDTDAALGFYFGRRGGTFELLWVDAVEPCSA